RRGVRVAEAGGWRKTEPLGTGLTGGWKGGAAEEHHEGGEHSDRSVPGLVPHREAPPDEVVGRDLRNTTAWVSSDVSERRQERSISTTMLRQRPCRNFATLRMQRVMWPSTMASQMSRASSVPVCWMAKHIPTGRAS